MSGNIFHDLPIATVFLDKRGRLVEHTRGFVELLRRHGVDLDEDLTYGAIVQILLDASTIEPQRRAEFVSARTEALLSERSDVYVLRLRSGAVLRLYFEHVGERGSMLSIGDFSEVEQREALFAAAERLSRSGVWALDLSSGAISFSDSCWDLFGPGSKEKMGTLDKWVSFIHPDDLERVQAAIARTLGTYEPYDIGYRVYRTDGRLIHIEAKGEIVFDGKGQARTARGVFHDITERREAEEALKNSEARSNAIINNNPDIISVLDAEGRFAFVSPSIKTMLGYEQSELLGRPALELVHPEDIPMTGEALRRTLATPGHRESVELRFRHKDESWRSIEVIGRNLLEEPAVGGLLLNTRDITERRVAEAQLRQSQKMEAIGQLTGGIAHDFNNLLAVVVGNLDLLSLDLGDEAERRRLIEQAIEAAERGRSLTARLLSFARQQPVELRRIDLNALMLGMEELLKRTLGATIELDINLAPDLWVCEVDQALMENAVLNLAINARDAMPNGGRLTIRTENKTLDDEDRAALDGLSAGDYITVLVSDTGVGMSRQIASRVFEPFFTTKERGKGSGLGLSMVYGFAKQSHGLVRVDSEPGVGTTFRIYLPRCAAPKQAQERAPFAKDDAPPGHGETIFVVEDDPNVLSATVGMLDRLGYNVMSAENASAALETLHTAKDVQLLLTDFFLEGGERGSELARKAREILPGLRVLYMSGYAEGLTIPEGGAGTTAGFLPKPFRKLELAQKLRHALD